MGWLLAELEQRSGYSLDELARRFDHSVSWVSRRLAPVEVPPGAIQPKVREGKILAQSRARERAYGIPVLHLFARHLVFLVGNDSGSDPICLRIAHRGSYSGL